MEHIGAKQSIGLAKETVRGTGVSTGIFWIAKTGGAGLVPNFEYINEESGIGRIETVRDSRKVKEGSRLEFEGILTDKSTGILLLGVFSDVATTTPEAGVYKHSFTIKNDNLHQSFTAWNIDPVTSAGTGAERSDLMMMDSFEIEAAAGEYGRFTTSFTGRKINEDSAPLSTPTYTGENKFSFDDVNIKIVQAANKAAAITAFSGATPIRLSRFRISFAKNLMESQELGSADINEIFNQNFTLEGDFDAVYRDKTYFDYVDNGGKYYMQVEIKNTNVTIGLVNNPTIKFITNKTSFQSWSKTSDVNGIVTQTCGFVGEFNETDSEMVSCDLINTTTSY